MRPERDALFLHDIVEAARRVLEFTGGDEDAFLESELVQSAVIRQFEVMGEATKCVSEAVRERHPEIPWRDMAAFRDRLIHGYMTVDPVMERLPEVIGLVDAVRDALAIGG